MFSLAPALCPARVTPWCPRAPPPPRACRRPRHLCPTHAEYDLLHKLAPFMDVHLLFPVLNYYLAKGVSCLAAAGRGGVGRGVAAAVPLSTLVGLWRC